MEIFVVSLLLGNNRQVFNVFSSQISYTQMKKPKSRLSGDSKETTVHLKEL